MAGRILNRRELREQADGAERAAAEAPDTGAAAVKPAKKVRVKAAAAPRVRKARAKKPPARRSARWGVFDGGMKQVAIFDYSQRGAADAKVASLNVKKAGQYFLQVVKDPMPAAAPADEPSA